jgi:hypothetical protein
MSRRTLDVAREGVLHMARRPLRSALSALTSAIAIAVTVNVISLSFGFDEDIRGDVDLFGRRTIDVGRLPVIVPGARRPSLGPAEAERIRERLADLDPVVVPRRQVVTRGRAPNRPADVEPVRLSLVAALPAYLRTLSVPVAAGRWLRADDPDGRNGDGACTLDAATVRLLFGDVPSRQVLDRGIDLEIGGRTRRYRIVGVLADPLQYRELFEIFDEGRGSRTLAASLLSFRNVYVPETALEGGEYSGISIALPSDEAVDAARQRLLKIWSVDATDPTAVLAGGVGVFVRRDWMDALGASTRQGTMIGNVIWMIVVLVAAVMISTLNLITVRERYDEIALRRCEGARRRDVALQITVEGTLTALAGGLLGLPIGYAGAALLRRVVDFPLRFELRHALAATAIAVLLGLIASVLPARHAARLQPARVLGRRLR